MRLKSVKLWIGGSNGNIHLKIFILYIIYYNESKSGTGNSGISIQFPSLAIWVQNGSSTLNKTSQFGIFATAKNKKTMQNIQFTHMHICTSCLLSLQWEWEANCSLILRKRIWFLKALPWEFLETRTGMGSNSSSLAVSALEGSKPEIKQESAAKRWWGLGQMTVYG